jgi:colanic acid/amylovoran biosynthesis glycosyltransferase
VTTVLHVLHTWGHPSHTFVRALVTGVPGTHPVVVAEELVGPPPADLTLHLVGGAPRLLARVAGKTMVVRAWRAGRRAGVDLVHAHFAHELLLAERAARLLRRPLVVSLHGRDLLVEVDGRPDLLAVLHRADAVVVPSSFLATAATERGIEPHRIAIIPSGIDPDEIPFRLRPASPAEVPLVLFVGRFVEKKGVLRAARAVVRVGAERPLRARFVGGGPLHDDLEAALAPLGPAAQVVDGRDRTAVLQALDDADLLISPSETTAEGDAETLLVVNIEAQAAGLPVLTADHGGIPSGLGPGAAVVVPERDDEALAAALCDLLDHPERWAGMGRAGREHVVEHLTCTLTGQRTAALYRSVLAGTGVPDSLRSAGSQQSSPKATA